jgi:phosphoenolpyruvate carboxykinase (ATP)
LPSFHAHPFAAATSIHDGSLAKAEFESFPVFNLSVPKSVNNVPDEILDVSFWPVSGSLLSARVLLAD